MPNPSELERMDQENRDAMAHVSGQVLASTPEQTQQAKDEEAGMFDAGEYSVPGPSRFEDALQNLINSHSMENGCDTPDFILARYLRLQLDTFNRTVRRRETWYGR